MNRRWLPHVILAAMDHIEANLEEAWSLQTMAQSAGFSPGHFHRKFRSATGETPVGFLERIRLERAALLLLSSTTSITALAWRCGFRNPETFARRFRAQFGVTARDYRRHQVNLWGQLGFTAGRDPVAGPERILVSHVPAISIAVRRSYGDDEGFDYSPHKPVWDGTPDSDIERFGITLDQPGITEPGRVRQDWGVHLNDGAPSEWARRTVGGGWYAHLTIRGPNPVPNICYQRLFVWSMGGRYQMRPGPIIEIWRNDTTTVHQPVTDTTGE